MRKRLVIHIGMHKTGSSAIQHFLSRNRLALRACGVLYPASIGADGRRQPKHNALFTAISHEADHGAAHPMLGPSRALVEQLRERIERTGANMAIISAEGFSGEKPDFAAALAPLGEAFDVKVLVFLRRPDEWLTSFHRQMIMSREIRETRALPAFAEASSTRLHMDYPRILSWWAEVFGGTAMTIARYDAEDPDLVGRFLTLARAPKALRLVRVSRARRNLSAPIEATLARLAENRGEGRSARTEELFLTLDEKVELMNRLKDDWSSSMVSLSAYLDTPPFISLMLDEMEAEIGTR
ncbi:MAG: hypothetical protein AAFN79_05875 [Pseudomonadota bacterium]